MSPSLRWLCCQPLPLTQWTISPPHLIIGQILLRMQPRYPTPSTVELRPMNLHLTMDLLVLEPLSKLMEQRYESLMHNPFLIQHFSASLMETSKKLETPVSRTPRIVRMVSRFPFGKKWNIPWISSMSLIQQPSKRGSIPFVEYTLKLVYCCKGYLLPLPSFHFILSHMRPQFRPSALWFLFSLRRMQ